MKRNCEHIVECVLAVLTSTTTFTHPEFSSVYEKKKKQMIIIITSNTPQQQQLFFFEKKKKGTKKKKRRMAFQLRLRSL